MDELTKRGPGRPRKDSYATDEAPTLKPVKLLKGYFPASGGKIAAGSEIELPADEARALVACGKAVRNDIF